MGLFGCSISTQQWISLLCMLLISVFSIGNIECQLLIFYCGYCKSASLSYLISLNMWIFSEFSFRLLVVQERWLGEVIFVNLLDNRKFLTARNLTVMKFVERMEKDL